MAGARLLHFPGGSYHHVRVCERCPTELKAGDPGALCEGCRDKAGPVPLSFVLGTLADASRSLTDVVEGTEGPLPLPVVKALESIQRAFDGLAPHLSDLQLGRIIDLGGEIWAYPCTSSEALGPFFDREQASRALIQHAVRFGVEHG